MLRFAKFPIAFAVMASVFLAAAAPASAACKKMGFLVNDYGKEGPTKDAQKMLDKHIAKWADEQGINEYSVGKKTVKCELFLNLILFDEHTCTASATVCWGGSKQPRDKKSQTAKAKSKKSSKSNKQAKAKPAKSTSKVVKTVSDKTKKPAATGSAIETSAIPRYVADPGLETPPGGKTSSADVVARAPAATEAVPKADDAKATSIAAERDAADRAAAAAERAAAAAEKAAKAAELAAEAAKQAAAVSRQTRAAATVAPVTPKEP